jgi:hypothetical protein
MAGTGHCVMVSDRARRSFLLGVCMVGPLRAASPCRGFGEAHLGRVPSSVFTSGASEMDQPSAGRRHAFLGASSRKPGELPCGKRSLSKIEGKTNKNSDFSRYFVALFNVR